MTSWERHQDAAENAATGDRLIELIRELGWLGVTFPELYGQAGALIQAIYRLPGWDEGM